MATRPVFIAQVSSAALVRTEWIDFTWYPGMAKPRRQMSMRSLHEATQSAHPRARILEVSRMSDDELGDQLSAFNLSMQRKDSGKEIPVECAFQASKVFERGGPFLDLLSESPVNAKRDPRLQGSGRLTGFRFFDEDWPTEPPTAFYDWMYINALRLRPALASAVAEYDIFTDIAFNPKKSINCQASAVALYVALVRGRQLCTALSSRHAFLEIYKCAILRNDTEQTQASLF